tara:strand:+ start:1183 stop:2625 length:1443 start_codon:yes stop_codon:yes gene_type:complete
MKTAPIMPVIMCGGTGSRLWPLSRESFPKQYLSLNSKDYKSLLQNTLERLQGIDNLESPLVICNEEHRFIVAEQLRGIDINPSKILLEPFGRNTAPAITMAALIALKNSNESNLLILSSDHEIKNKEKFLQIIKLGFDYANKGRLVTFGVVPKTPETGYGYIKARQELDLKNIIGTEIEEFIEKPNLLKAKELIKDKKYTWNSGIFLFKAKTILNEVSKFAPDVISICNESLENISSDMGFQRLNKDIFFKCPNISIDVAVMEKTKLGTVLPLDADWSDIGSWNSVWKTSTKNTNNNFIKGNVVEQDTYGCYLRSESRLITAIGLKNLIIVETNDAILVADQEASEKVKDVVQYLKNHNYPESIEHKKIYRPWGNYTKINEGDRWKVKKIFVKPGEKLSLQLHHHRAEHWIVVNGTAAVEVDDEKLILYENQSTYIPLGSKHRLSNPGKSPLILIEVQSGSYLGEDDIKRFEDSYGRLDN